MKIKWFQEPVQFEPITLFDISLQKTDDSIWKSIAFFWGTTSRSHRHVLLSLFTSQKEITFSCVRLAACQQFQFINKTFFIHWITKSHESANKVLCVVVRVMFIGNQLVNICCAHSQNMQFINQKRRIKSIKEHKSWLQKKHPSKSAIVLVNNSSKTTMFVASFIANGIRMVGMNQSSFRVNEEKNRHFERLRPKCIIFLVLSPFSHPTPYIACIESVMHSRTMR